MIKNVLIGSLCFMASVALADLEGGSIITAHAPTDAGCTATRCNGRKFYVSDKGMTWWTIFTWCRANGLEPASFAEACPPGNLIYSGTSDSCINLKDALASGTMYWLNFTFPDDASQAYVLYDKTFPGWKYPKKSEIRALCIIPEEE